VSGIVGLWNLDGAPVDRQLFAGMMAFLAFRGPDAQTTWVDGSIGLGHTLLRTTWESEREQQPCSLDGNVWITADARIDDRATLIAKLARKGRTATLNAPDAELILHAHHAWGERCVEQLLGDFAFAIWDGRQQRLFCARDHFGIKGLFYAQLGNCFVISNTLYCIHQHPAASTTLNDLAIADFLLFGENKDVSTTAYAGVRRLAPAHCLSCSAAGFRTERYWTLPIDRVIRHRRATDYAEELKERLTCAVADRLRSPCVGIHMSGGLDSTSVAAVAQRLVPSTAGPRELRAFTVVFDRLIPDEERSYAGLAAQGLGIPIHYFPADDYGLYEGWDRHELDTPEPSDGPSLLLHRDWLRRIAAHGRVALTGHGCDPALMGSPAYAAALVRTGHWAQLAADLGHALACGSLPKVGFRARLRRWRTRRQPPPTLPPWINPRLAKRLDLAERWSRFQAQERSVHPRRPESWRALTAPFWPGFFELYDAGVTGVPGEHWHPFFDLRVMGYLLAIPAIPWCDNKAILRLAMRGLLPEAIRGRPKTPLGDDPYRALLQREESAWVDRFEAAPDLHAFVVRERIPPLFREGNSDAIWNNLRPLSLNYWLQRRKDARLNPGNSLASGAAGGGSQACVATTRCWRE
jgi:asparagine synthase (glutamine-hydrolysing)